MQRRFKQEKKYLRYISVSYSYKLKGIVVKLLQYSCDVRSHLQKKYFMKIWSACKCVIILLLSPRGQLPSDSGVEPGTSALRVHARSYPYSHYTPSNISFLSFFPRERCGYYPNQAVFFFFFFFLDE